MDFVSVLIILGILVLCLLPLLFGSLRNLDRRADDVQGEDPETARALREARKNIDRGKGWNLP